MRLRIDLGSERLLSRTAGNQWLGVSPLPAAIPRPGPAAAPRAAGAWRPPSRPRHAGPSRPHGHTPGCPAAAAAGWGRQTCGQGRCGVGRILSQCGGRCGPGRVPAEGSPLPRPLWHRGEAEERRREAGWAVSGRRARLPLPAPRGRPPARPPAGAASGWPGQQLLRADSCSCRRSCPHLPRGGAPLPAPPSIWTGERLLPRPEERSGAGPGRGGVRI